MLLTNTGWLPVSWPALQAELLAHLPCASSPVLFCTPVRRKLQEVKTSAHSSFNMVAQSSREAASIDEEASLREQSDLLDSFCQMPAIDKAWLLPSQTGKNLEAIVISSQVNLLANSKRKFASFVRILKEGNDDKTTFEWSPFPLELSGASLVVPSHTGKKLLVIRNGDSKGKDAISSTKLEIWSSSQLVKEIIVPASVHGSVYADGWFEGVSWNQDESFVAYVAEEAISKKPVFGRSPGLNESNSENDPYVWKGQGDWQEDWGESYSGKQRPLLYIADLQTGIVEKVKGIPNGLNVGQVVWAPQPLDGKPQLLVFVGWSSTSENFKTCKKLGIKHCFNRPCGLYAIEAWPTERNLSPCLQALTSSISSAFMPLFSPDGQLLVFLSAQAAVRSGAHNATNSLYVLHWPVDGAQQSLLKLKEVVSAAPPPEVFPGLYCHNFSSIPWLSDGHTLVLSTPWFSIQVILTVNVKSGEVLRITPLEDSGSWNVMCVKGNHILAVRSSFDKPASLKLGVPCVTSDAKISDVTSDAKISDGLWRWLDIENHHLYYPDKVNQVLSSITYNIMDMHVAKGQAKEELFQAIFISSKAPIGEAIQKNQPLVVVLHGGPHSVYTTAYSRNFAFLIGLGLNLLLVNYRGSLGFGEHTLQSLLGNAGCQDVNDVLVAVDHAIAQGLADVDKVAVIGGSHGGFLSMHLIGQAPDQFVTAAVVNPVCNMSSLVGTTDIPDWCYVETYGKDCFSVYSDAPSSGDLENFYKASPIAYIDKVKVPTLFLLGAHDRRVPISNGFQYIHALRSRGLMVKSIVFPEDSHPIDRPQSDYECWLNIGAWLKKHLEP